MEKTQRELFEKGLQEFGDRFSLTRVKTESFNFDHDYKRGADNGLHLVSEKAVIKTLGKTTKVRIGEGGEYATYAEAAVGVRAFWSAYFKERRNRRTEAEKRGEARRQKRYRERRKQEAGEFEQRR